MSTEHASPPLEGVRVIDLTHYIAGPYCTKLLADYGADVIKIERPDGGDPARRMAPFFQDQPHLEGSGLFLHINTNKRSLTLNLKSQAGRKIFLDLVRDADIVVESFSPRVMPSLDLAYETLEAVNPKLIMASLSNYGQTGPYRDYKASEITLYAMGGSMFQTGEEYREPVKLGMTVEQFYCGTIAASATMGAFMGATLHGIGQHLDLSLHELMTGNQDRSLTNLTDYQHAGTLPYRHLESSSGFSPTFPVADGYVQFYSIPRTWKRICAMIDHPELADDPELNNPTRPESKDTVVVTIMEWLDGRKKQDVMELAQTFGIFCTVVNTPEDVFRDPHVAERGFLVEVDHPYTGPLRYAGAPFRMAATPWRAGRAPLLGEHTSEVLQGLGYSSEDVVQLREQGAI